MSIYFLIEMTILGISIYWILINTSFAKSRSYGGLTYGNCTKDYTRSNIYLFICTIILVTLGGMRGGFTQDYYAYRSFFYDSINYNMFEVITQFKDPGFLLLSKAIRTLTSSSEVFFSIISLIIVLANLIQFKKESPYVWLSILMFLCLGNYYTSFNILRQILACSLSFLMFNLITNKKIYKYFICTFLISTIHKSALILIPFYFLLRINWSKRNKLIITFISILIFSIVFIYPYFFINIMKGIVYENYNINSYGISWGLPISSLIKPGLILLFILIHNNIIDKNNIKERILLNANLYYFGFSLLAIRVEMFTRLSHYFAPYILILIPYIISKIKNKRHRALYLIGGVILLLIYSTVTKGLFNSNYYFIWR